jgi:hypothetical protein
VLPHITLQREDTHHRTDLRHTTRLDRQLHALIGSHRMPSRVRVVAFRVSSSSSSVRAAGTRDWCRRSRHY